VLDEQLVVAARLVQADAPAHQKLLARDRAQIEQPVAGAEHRRAHLGVLVLEREIPVPGRRAGKIRELALHPHQRQMGFEQLARAAIQRRNAEHLPSRGGDIAGFGDLDHGAL
jgi:hypothetical protein